MSLATRGSGQVGEMTKLLSAAFKYTFEAAEQLHREQGKAGGGLILLVDEADSLTQSQKRTKCTMRTVLV